MPALGLRGNALGAATTQLVLSITHLASTTHLQPYTNRKHVASEAAKLPDPEMAQAKSL